VWVLALDAAAPELRDRLLAALPELEGAVAARLPGGVHARQLAVRVARLGIIRPILAAPKGSAERAAAYRAAAAERHLIGGRLGRVAEPTLRAWARRPEAGRRRVLVSRAWDKGIDLPEERKAEVAARLDRYAASLIANDGTSAREVIRLSGLKLRRLSAEASSQLGPARLARLCRVTTKWVVRFAALRLSHAEAKDHKAWQDRAMPRIRRELAERPMSLLAGDVHHMDLLVTAGGDPVRVRLIAWMDTASLFLWVTPVFLPAGKGIRQEDVARSLAPVVLDKRGGLPDGYCLDNGSEYGALDGAASRLGIPADRIGGYKVHSAKPYSPQSKGMIEGAFGVLQGIYAGWPGYIGGDRTDKKCANKGQVVAPYDRGLVQLADDIAAMVASYNSRPQSGRLKGRSPLQALDTKIAATGFVARVPDEDAFDAIFSRSETRMIRQE
jgi:hypothetical protein